MIEFDDLPVLRKPVLIVAFEGWNDAAESASGAVTHLSEVWDAQILLELDPEEYYDYQVNRPHIYTTDSGERGLIWPATKVFVARGSQSDRDFVLILGIEPNMKWPQFTREVLGLAAELDVELVITMGALLSDNPHSRPVPISATASDRELLSDLQLDVSHYEGLPALLGFSLRHVRNSVSPVSLCGHPSHIMLVSLHAPKRHLLSLNASKIFSIFPYRCESCRRSHVHGKLV